MSEVEDMRTYLYDLIKFLKSRSNDIESYNDIVLKIDLSEDIEYLNFMAQVLESLVDY